MSQYLIKKVIYEGDQEPQEILFRTVIFRLFNRVSTYELLSGQLGEPNASAFDPGAYARILEQAVRQGQPLYSAAYIIPPAGADRGPKFLTHLRLAGQMLVDRLVDRLTECSSMAAAFQLLANYRGLGPFLAYQLVIDLNYSRVLDFSEMEFVVTGPGAQSGLRKCFVDPGDYDDAGLIRWLTERQDQEFASRQLNFKSLFGRPLQLIDCQNLLCEVDKYSRLAHPEIPGSGGRTRIKQRFAGPAGPISLWLPPKWGLEQFSLAQGADNGLEQ